MVSTVLEIDRNNDPFFLKKKKAWNLKIYTILIDVKKMPRGI